MAEEVFDKPVFKLSELARATVGRDMDQLSLIIANELSFSCLADLIVKEPEFQAAMVGYFIYGVMRWARDKNVPFGPALDDALALDRRARAGAAASTGPVQ